MKTVHERNMISSFSSIFTSLGLNVKIVVTRLSKRNFGERKKKKILERLTLRKIEKKKYVYRLIKVNREEKEGAIFTTTRLVDDSVENIGQTGNSNEIESGVGRLTFLKTVRAIRATSPKLVPSEPIALKFSRISSR